MNIEFRNCFFSRIEFERFYTGNELDTDRRNIDVKKRRPLAPPGTSPKIIRNNVMVWITAVTTVSRVLCINIAK